MSESELILNPKTNRFVKKTSQTGKRLLKELTTPPVIQPTQPTPPITSQPIVQPQPVQTAIIESCVSIVADNTSKFKNLTPQETDALFKKLLIEKLAPAKANPKKKKGFRVVSSESESETSD